MELVESEKEDEAKEPEERINACIQGSSPSNVVVGEERESGNSRSKTEWTCCSKAFVVFDAATDVVELDVP